MPAYDPRTAVLGIEDIEEDRIEGSVMAGLATCVSLLGGRAHNLLELA